jgi:hypothetical protein
MRLICNYGPFEDSNILCRLLAIREDWILETILVSLGGTRKAKNERKEGKMY